MAKIQTLSPASMKRVGKVVKIVEAMPKNGIPASRPPQPNRRHNHICMLDGDLFYNSTGVQASVMSGVAPSLSTGYGTIRVFGNLLGASTNNTIESGGVIVATWISGAWQATAYWCT